jgi:AraC-like DNA-binding protein
MGEKSFYKLLDYIKGKAVEPVTIIPSQLVIRESCGCLNVRKMFYYHGNRISEKMMYNVHKIEITRLKKQKVFLNLITQACLGATTIGEINQMMLNEFPNIDIKGCFIMIFDDDNHKAKLICQYQDRHIPPMPAHPYFDEKKILGVDIKKSMCGYPYIIMSLHNKEKVFGYVVFEVSHPDVTILEQISNELSNAISGTLLSHNKIAGGNKKDTLPPKYEKSSLFPEQIQQYAEELISLMNAKKPYLNENLKLNDLAEMLRIPHYHLSQVINNYIGLSYNDFINNYRLKKVKELLADPVKNNFTILALAFEAGFNSSATFYRIFKKNLHMSPLDYQKKLHKK